MSGSADCTGMCQADRVRPAVWEPVLGPSRGTRPEVRLCTGPLASDRAVLPGGQGAIEGARLCLVPLCSVRRAWCPSFVDLP